MCGHIDTCKPVVWWAGDISIVGSFYDLGLACSASDTRARISIPVSGGQYHLIHIPSLNCMSTEEA